MKEAPLLKSLCEHLRQKYTGFHTPGHQGGHGGSQYFFNLMEKYGIKMDLTELPGLDNLKRPSECIQRAQKLAAHRYGACQTFFLVNGSTIGLQAALLALNRPNKKVMLTRHSHISVINGLVLTGGNPVIAPVQLDYRWNIPLGTTSGMLKSVLDSNPDVETVVLTSPSYQGTGIDCGEYRQLMGNRSISVIVDEAHGSHLYFQSKLALSAQKQGYDVVIHSTHKTLGSLTQSSLLHVNRGDLIEPLERSLGILHTTSPSYLLMGSLDGVQQQMGLEGPLLVEETMELAEGLRSAIRKIKGYSLFGDELEATWLYDPTKIIISARALGLTGWELASILRDHGIMVEFSDYYYVLLLITIGHERSHIEYLLKALREISKYHKKKNSLPPMEKTSDIYELMPHLQLTPRQVFWSNRSYLPIRQAVGRITGDVLVVYPPGIPLLWPGQIIEPVHVDYLEWAYRHSLPISGLTEELRLAVVSEE